MHSQAVIQEVQLQDPFSVHSSATLICHLVGVCNVLYIFIDEASIIAEASGGMLYDVASH